MQQLHVLMRKEDLDSARLQDKVVVVFDVIFATTTIATAFQHGAPSICPAVHADDARLIAKTLPADSYLLAGEKNIQPIPGFLTAAPLSLAQTPLAGKQLIYSTTNGTVALREASSARAGYAAALVNNQAVAKYLARQHHRETIVLVCAGSGGGFNIEDFLGAGHFVEHLMQIDPDRWLLSDAALAAHGLYQSQSQRLLACLQESRLGRVMHSMGGETELEHAARADVYDCVPVMQEGR